MKSSKNKSEDKGLNNPALFSSYLVEASGIAIEEVESSDVYEEYAVRGRQVVEDALNAFENQQQEKDMLNNFGVFLELLRRRDKLTREQLSAKADVDLSEIIQLETEQVDDVSPRTLYQLERCFQLNENTLSKLCGAVTNIEGFKQSNIVRYAAQAKHANRLNNEEMYILNQVISLLDKKESL